jgi:hypothetical protein
VSINEERLDASLVDAIGWPVQPTPSTDEERIEDLRTMLADRAARRRAAVALVEPARLELELRLEAARKARP